MPGVRHLQRRLNLRVVESVFGLTLKLRLGNKDGDDRDESFADVFVGNFDPSGNQVVGVDIIAHRFGQPGPKSIFVRAAAGSWDAVDIGADVLVGRFGPLQRQFDPFPFVLGK